MGKSLNITDKDLIEMLLRENQKLRDSLCDANKQIRQKTSDIACLNLRIGKIESDSVRRSEFDKLFKDYNDLADLHSKAEKEHEGTVRKYEEAISSYKGTLRDYEITIEDYKNKLEEIKKALIEAQLIDIKRANELFGISSERITRVYPVSDTQREAIDNKEISREEKKARKKVGRKKGKQNFDSFPGERKSQERYAYDGNISSLANPKGFSKGHKTSIESTRVFNKLIYVRGYLKCVTVTTELVKDEETGATSYVKTPYDGDSFGLSSCTPSLGAFLATMKFYNYLPSERISNFMALSRTPLSKELINRYLISASKALNPLFLHWCEVLKGRKIMVIHADETTFLNLACETNITNYFWTVTSGDGEKVQIVLYFYFDDRKHEHVKDMLGEGYDNVVITDAYGAYAELVQNAGCWSHARRYLFEYLQSIQAKKLYSKDQDDFLALLKLVEKMFAKEREIKGLSDDKIIDARSQVIKGYVDDYFKKVKELHNPHIDDVRNKALRYSINNEEKLRKFLTNPRIVMSNNKAERSCRKLVLLRSNILFSESDEGAKEIEVLLSIVNTAVSNLLDPQAYIQYVLENIGKLPIEDFDPWNHKLPKELYRTSDVLKK